MGVRDVVSLVVRNCVVKKLGRKILMELLKIGTILDEEFLRIWLNLELTTLNFRIIVNFYNLLFLLYQWLVLLTKELNLFTFYFFLIEIFITCFLLANLLLHYILALILFVYFLWRFLLQIKFLFFFLCQLVINF